MSRFALIGDPVDHSLSPAMHHAAYRALNLDHMYEAIRVPTGDVVVTLSQLRDQGYAGVNVTVPHKQEALVFGEPDAFSRRAGAVNTIDLRSGSSTNTDAPGFLRVLARAGAGTRVLLLGAGGSAKALAIATAEAGYDLTIWNRTAEKARALAEQCAAEAVYEPVFDAYDVVVNATSASLAGELPLAIDANPVDRKGQGLAIDLYYTGTRTPFVRRFDGLGWRTMDGRELLVDQGALAFEFWLGIEAPREAMRIAVGL